MDNWISRSKVGLRFGKAGRTISNWVADESLGFPKPVIIKGRVYFSEAAIEAWRAAKFGIAAPASAASHAGILPPAQRRRREFLIDRTAETLEVEAV